jgi:hypothetical protein
MARPLVGIYATVAPVSWGPWRDRPSVLAPAALGAAVQRAGGMVVLLAPDPEPGSRELLRMLDALIVLDAGVEDDHLAALVTAARELELAVLVLEASRVTPASTLEDYEREIRGLLPAR